MLEQLVREKNKEALEKYLQDKKALSPQALLAELNQEIDPHTKWNILHVAAFAGDKEILMLLIKNNPGRLDPLDFLKRTPLWSAALKGLGDCAQVLIECGANVNHLDENNTNLLHWVFSSKRTVKLELAKFLLRFGINCRQADKSNDTPLYLVYCNKFSDEWWTLLLDHGAGICCDFSKMLEINPEILKKITKDKVVFGARSPVELDQAITDFAKLESAIKKGIKFDFKALENIVRKLTPEEKSICEKLIAKSEVPLVAGIEPVNAPVSESRTDAELNVESEKKLAPASKEQSLLIKELKRLKRLQKHIHQESQVKSLRTLSIRYVVSHIMLQSNPNNATKKLQERVYSLPSDLYAATSIKVIKQLKR